MLAYKQVTVGADPEVFLRITKTGEFVSAIGKIGGSKEDPKLVPDAPGFAIQEDNVAAEFNIPPSTSAAQFSANIKKGMIILNKLARKYKAQIACVPAVHFDPKQLAHPMAQRLGCDPDFNVWTGEQNPRPAAPPSLRTAAGHVHIGWQEPNKDQRDALIKALDVFLALPMVLMFPPNERKSLYGKAGAFRPKPYGVEYRTPSNEWLPDKIYRKWVYDQVILATQTLNFEGQILIDDLNLWQKDIQETINEHNVKAAEHLCALFNVSLPATPKDVVEKDDE